METGTTNNNYTHKLILVYYIDVRHLNDEEVPYFMKRVMKNIRLESSDIGEIIALPVKNASKVECINPKYITEPELIREHRLKIDELHEIMEKFINENNDGRKS